MNGIQFYLAQDVPLEFGHSPFYADSPLGAYFYIANDSFWSHAQSLSDFGDGKTWWCSFSVDISDWETPGNPL